MEDQLAKLRRYVAALGGTLPDGWTCKAHIRDVGSRAGSVDTWFYGPAGEVFRSKVAVSAEGGGGEQRGAEKGP